MLRENYGPSPAAKARHLVRPSVRVRPSFVLSFFRLSSCGCSGSAISNPLICVGLWLASGRPESSMLRHPSGLGYSNEAILREYPNSARIWPRLPLERLDGRGRTWTAVPFISGIGKTSCLQAAIISLAHCPFPSFSSPDPTDSKRV